MNLKITDGERARYTAIYGRDPLATDGWLTLRMKNDLRILGYELDGDFDLLNACDAPSIDVLATRGTGRVLVRIQNSREDNATRFCVIV